LKPLTAGDTALQKPLTCGNE